MANSLLANGRLPDLGLQSREHEEVLNVIDQLRSQGINQYIDLPQLIVCGDQSSGKSSVLNAISGLMFPAKDNVCTRFATELVLRRGDVDDIQVNIRPHVQRPESEKNMLQKFTPTSISLERFGDIVERAGEAMSMGSNVKTFFKDVLRVEVTGPRQPHLTMVDLPGLFHANTTEQSGADTVDTMVRAYMENTRCIILAVISAKNELALQKVTTLTRDIDPIGRRTLGIITKPDWLKPGSDMERAFVTLANNGNIEFRLGWHILKNRDDDHRDCNGEERDRLEAEWLSRGVWATLPRHQLGVNALKDRLCAVLQDLILSEIPSLTQDLEAAAKVANAGLMKLGDARENVSQQRRYLIHSSEKFVSLLSYAIHGIYDADKFFGDPRTDDGFRRRLRAVFKCTLKEFSDKMSADGQARKIIDDTEWTGEDTEDCVSRSNYVKEVRMLMARTQGRELPGTYNPMIVGDLFYAQAKPWPGIVAKYTERLMTYTRWYSNALSLEVFDAKTAQGLQKQVLTPAIDVIEGKLQEKITEILLPHQQGHPITQNHYFIENIQKARLQHWKNAVSANLSSNADEYDQRFTKAEVLNAMNAMQEVDMERFACLEAIDCMEAYYKVPNV